MTWQERQRREHVVFRADFECYGCHTPIGRRVRLPLLCIPLCQDPKCLRALTTATAQSRAREARMPPDGSMTTIEERP